MAHTPSPVARRSALTTALGLVLAAAGMLLLELPQARAADNETRSFSITVDGKSAGEYQMNIQRQADGSVSMAASSNVRVTVLAIPVYTYSYRGKEIWKNGQLQHFESAGKEKGKEFSVRADVDGSALRVIANGQEHTTRHNVWTTSCWQLPPAAYRNNEIVLMGCDTGAVSASRLQFIGTEKINVAGTETTCTHYRVVRDSAHDLWYDAQERLVRDESVSSGHRTVIEMTGVR
jgi:hypothetical protein